MVLPLQPSFASPFLNRGCVASVKCVCRGAGELMDHARTTFVRMRNNAGRSQPWLRLVGVCLSLAVLILSTGCGEEQSAPVRLEGSFYQAEIRDGDLRVADMIPTAIVEADCVELGAECPPNLTLLEGPTNAAELNAKYLQALHIDLFSSALDECCGDHATALRRVLAALKSSSAAADPADRMKSLVKHYPHPRAGKDFIVLHATFFTVPDTHFEQGRLATMRGEAGSVPGVMLETRATYRTDVTPPRLVEAVVEVSEELREAGRRIATTTLLRREQIPAGLRDDPQWGGHFFEYGGGVRRGLYWCDRNMGQGTANPWSIAYMLDGRRSTSLPDIKTHETSDEGRAAVQTVAGSI